MDRHGLLLSEIKRNLLLRFVHRPPVVLLILNEVIEVQHVSEVNKAIGLICLVGLPVVHYQIQVIEPAFVILLKVSLDILF